MFTIDVQKLVSAITQVKADTNNTIIERGINPYLLANVILPFLSDKEVDLRNLDYSAFDMDDIYDANSEIEGLSESTRKTFSVAEAVKKAAPVVACKSKAFC